MENRTRFLKTTENRRGGSIKFKPIKPQYNELQSKFQIYKNGTPNNYEQNVESLKAYHIKNNIKTLQLPVIDYVLQELKNVPENTGTNLRDFSIHPSSMQKYGNKFRNLVSDSQEIKDFLQWFQQKQKQINSKNCGATEKFYLNQSLIASGFNEMLTQISFVSKMRAEVLRTLWNKQNCQVEQVFSYMHKQSSEFQKKSLQTLKVTHLSYQQQIIGLRNDNYCGEKKLEEAVILNQSCINSLRATRKQIKKYQKIIKQLTQSNYTLKQQSLHILEQNIKLIMKQKSLPFEKARILAYQSLQARSMKRALNGNRKAKHIFKDVKSKAETIVQNNQLPDLEEKKQKLVKYILNRMKDNPGQKKHIMKNQFSDEDDEQIVLDKKIEQMIKWKQINQEINVKIPKQANFFNDKGVNTETIEFCPVSASPSEVKLQTVGVQTIANQTEKQSINVFESFKSQQAQGKKNLQKKKIEQRHTLMMIEMNKMMQFKKLGGSARAKRYTPVGKMIQSSQFSKISRFSSEVDEKNKSSIHEQSEPENTPKVQYEESMRKDPSQKQQNKELKNRELNIMRRHHQSLIAEKSSQFKQMIETISREIQEQKTPNDNTTKEEASAVKIDETDQKMLELKQLVIKYMEKKGIQKQLASNPEKQLKKILSHTFKNLFVSKKSNFLKQLIRTAKNSFGNVIYENKLVHLISVIIENREVSLLGALNILMAISTSSESCPQVNYEDVNEIYFRLYFYLSTKSPIENQFNIWNNYTTVQKINNSAFTEILKLYFSESKCMYLQLKIRQFIGVSREEDSSQSNYYVKLNPLMMYIMEVYLLEKQNYYESYHQIIDFLSPSQYMDLEIFVFLLDLLCFKEQQQKEIIKFNLKDDKQSHQIPYFNKDLFYRTCVKFEVPLFQFIKILKLQQFKKLNQCLQYELVEIGEYEKWNRTRQNIEKTLKMKGLYKNNIKNIISKMEATMKGSTSPQSQAFLFFYRIVTYIAFSPF